MIIYLARHGQTTGDVENRYGGDYDDHLTAAGRQQAAALGEQLSGQGIEQLFASPKIRAQETAAVVGRQLSLPIQTVAEFRERNSYGVMTGMIKEEAAKKYPEYAQGLARDVHYTVAGAEPYAMFNKRITTALHELTKVPAASVAVVTHGGPIRLIFRDVLQLGEIEIDDCAYAVLETRDAGYTLREMHGISLAGGDR
jgi:broad specificity phosphatase PhoE